MLTSAYCIGLPLLSSYHRFRIVCFGIMRSIRVGFFFLFCCRFVRAADLFHVHIFVGICWILSWRCVFSIHFVNFHLFFKVWTPVRFFPWRTFFFFIPIHEAIFFKWPICSTYVLYQPNDSFPLSCAASIVCDLQIHSAFTLRESSTIMDMCVHLYLYLCWCPFLSLSPRAWMGDKNKTFVLCRHHCSL